MLDEQEQPNCLWWEERAWKSKCLVLTLIIIKEFHLLKVFQLCGAIETKDNLTQSQISLPKTKVVNLCLVSLTGLKTQIIHISILQTHKIHCMAHLMFIFRA